MAIGLSLLITSSIRIAGLCAAAWLIALALRRSSAAARHLVWACAIVAALVTPGLLQLPTWPVVVPATFVPATRSGAPVSAVFPTDLSAGTAIVEQPVAPTKAVPVRERPQPRDIPILPIAFAVWATVAGIGLLWVWNGVAATARLRRTQARTHADWMAEGRAIAASMDLDRVTFLESPATSTPFTYGVIEPVVVLPADVADWTDERLRAVLLHELAHVRRHDCLTQLVTRVACAIYWFHPGVWFAARRLRIERERACDDVVLMAGIQGPVYGQHLVDIARAALALPSAVSAGGVAMAHRGRLEERLTSILDPRVVRHMAPSTRVVIAAFGMLAIAAATVHVKAAEVRVLTAMKPMVNAAVTAKPDAPAVGGKTDRDIPHDAAAAQAQMQSEAQTRTQAPAPTEATPIIEVAVIKRNKDEEDRRKAADPTITRYPGRAQTLRGGNISGRSMTVKELIRDAYGYRGRAASEVIGGPAWLDSEVYEVQAKFDREFRLSTSLGLPPEGELALRTLLAERFHLKAHTETQRRPIYEMVLQRADGKLGPNLKRSEGGCIPFSKREPVNVGLLLDQPAADDPKPLRPCGAAASIYQLILENEPMEDWARMLSVRPQLNRTVVDRTGLTGSFDFRLLLVDESMIRPGMAAPPLAPIKPMMESQMGLTLKDAQGNVEVLVIDSIDHPEEN